MIAHKHINKIVSVIVALAVVLCFAAMAFAVNLTAAAGGAGVSMEYESKLFNTDEPITVNILMDDADWNAMLSNASTEVYCQCDVQIAGQTFYRVGIRPKGNTSLSAIAMDPETDRFSFKLEFDQYVDGQTCFGLDKMILNNNYADATNMKEALIYDMYRYLGADASLYNYARVEVNGEYWGVYLALEAVEDSFLLRNYGVSGGELYKPEGMGMGGGGKPGGGRGGGDMDFDPGNTGFGNMPTPPDRAQGNQEQPLKGNEQNTANPNGAINGQPFGGNAGTSSDKPSDADGESGEENDPPADFDPGNMDFGNISRGGSGGANLNYSDDSLDSYSTIWEGEITKSNKADRKRVVTALKNISEGTELETYMDIDNLLRYMAVHVFSVNSDSLSGTMAHNYYLYEKDGQLNLIPWDYNLALGGMGGMGENSASSTINSAIDNAFSGTNFFDTLMENEAYYNQYHACLRQLVDEYINGGALEAFYTRTRAILDELVKTDPTAFYTYEEYSDAADTLYQVVKLRGQSIAGQLDGTIPSTEAEQRQNSSMLIDTGDLDLSIMGTMNMGGNGTMGGGGGFGGFGGGFRFGRGGFGGSDFDPSQAATPPERTPDTAGTSDI